MTTWFRGVRAHAPTDMTVEQALATVADKLAHRRQKDARKKETKKRLQKKFAKRASENSAKCREMVVGEGAGIREAREQTLGFRRKYAQYVYQVTHPKEFPKKRQAMRARRECAPAKLPKSTKYQEQVRVYVADF